MADLIPCEIHTNRGLIHGIVAVFFRCVEVGNGKFPEDFVADIVLFLEMVVDGAAVYMGLPTDIIIAGPVEPFFVKQLFAGVQYHPACGSTISICAHICPLLQN